MNETKSNLSSDTSERETQEFRAAKKQMDYIFVVNLVCIQKIHEIGSLEVDVSQMHIMGAWSQLYMNVSWLQRLYAKASLGDSEQVSIEIPLKGDRLLDLESVIERLEAVLFKIEQTNLQMLWIHIDEYEVPGRFFDLMLDRIYAGTYEALSLLEREVQLIENKPKEGDSDG